VSKLGKSKAEELEKNAIPATALFGLSNHF